MGTGNDVQVNIGPVLQEQTRLVPFKGPVRLVDGVPVEDLHEFEERIFLIGYTMRA